MTPLALRIRPDEAAVSGPLTPHGPAARRRRLTRAVVPALPSPRLLVVARLLWDWHGSLLVLVPMLLVGAVALGRDRYRALGHAVTPDHLVTRHGSLDRQRVVLDRAGIIGWKVEQSFFQRRVGVATLVATTAAGAQHYDVVDVPVEMAYAVLAQVSPDLSPSSPDTEGPSRGPSDGLMVTAPGHRGGPLGSGGFAHSSRCASAAGHWASGRALPDAHDPHDRGRHGGRGATT